jgi:biopolymer transport protein ExbD
MMNNLEMNLPSGKPPPPQKEKPKINRIEVNAKGQTFLNDKAVTIAELKEDLTQLKSDDPDLKVVVKGADDVDYQNMISVLDILQQLDITKVGLATEMQ